MAGRQAQGGGGAARRGCCRASASRPCASASMRAQVQAEAGAREAPRSEESSWVKGSKARGMSSGAMPMPVSATAIAKPARRRAGRATRRTLPPAGVNFTALPTSAEQHAAQPAFVAPARAAGRAAALDRQAHAGGGARRPASAVAPAPAASAATSTGVRPSASSGPPARATSRMSSISASSCRPASCIAPANSATCAGSGSAHQRLGEADHGRSAACAARGSWSRGSGTWPRCRLGGGARRVPARRARGGPRSRRYRCRTKPPSGVGSVVISSIVPFGRRRT